MGVNDKTIIGPVWITTHALTAPIAKIEQVSLDDDGRTLAWYQQSHGGYMDHAHGEGVEWHRTEESAHARVKVMAEAKIKSLDKSRAKMVQRLESGAKVVVAFGRPV